MTLLLLFPMTAAAIGVPLDAGGAAPRVRQVYYQARFEPPPLGQSFPIGWQQSLATAVPRAQAPVAQWQLPYSVAVTVAANQWQSPLSGAPPVARARFADWSLPYNIVNVVGVAWQPPLSTALSVAKAPQGFATVPLGPTPQAVTGWQQPLSTAPASAKTQAGYSFVPFNAAPTAGIAGMAWFTPLWTVPTRMLTTPQGHAFVPSTQIVVTTTPGQRRPTLFIANLGRLMNH